MKRSGERLIRTDAADGDEDVGVATARVGKQVLELPDLVAAVQGGSQVVALDEEPAVGHPVRPAELMNGGGQRREGNPRQPIAQAREPLEQRARRDSL